MKRLTVALLVVVLRVSALGDYTYEISSGYVSDLTLTGTQSLLMTGGGGLNLTAGDNTILDILNTSSPVASGKSGIVELNIGDSCQLNFSGGSLAVLSTGDDAIVLLSGGQISQIWGYYFFPADPLRITVYCQPGWTYQNGYLSGLWNDNTAFNIKLVTKSGSDVFSNMTIIPEPASLLLLAVGGLLLRRKRG